MRTRFTRAETALIHERIDRELLIARMSPEQLAYFEVTHRLEQINRLDAKMHAKDAQA